MTPLLLLAACKLIEKIKPDEVLDMPSLDTGFVDDGVYDACVDTYEQARDICRGYLIENYSQEKKLFCAEFAGVGNSDLIWEGTPLAMTTTSLGGDGVADVVVLGEGNRMTSVDFYAKCDGDECSLEYETQGLNLNSSGTVSNIQAADGSLYLLGSAGVYKHNISGGNISESGDGVYTGGDALALGTTSAGTIILTQNGLEFNDNNATSCTSSNCGLSDSGRGRDVATACLSYDSGGCAEEHVYIANEAGGRESCRDRHFVRTDNTSDFETGELDCVVNEENDASFVAEWRELDGDERQSLLVGTAGPKYLFRNTGSGFEEDDGSFGVSGSGYARSLSWGSLSPEFSEALFVGQQGLADLFYTPVYADDAGVLSYYRNANQMDLPHDWGNEFVLNSESTTLDSLWIDGGDDVGSHLLRLVDASLGNSGADAENSHDQASGLHLHRAHPYVIEYCE